jgi:hypothetical protein
MSTFRLTLTTTTTSSHVEGDATSIPGQDVRSRVVWSTDDAGRGASVTVRPLQADKQNVIHSIAVTVIPSGASDDEA